MNPEPAVQVTTERHHRVAVFGRVESLSVLATILCEITGMRLLDAIVVARSTPGILPLFFTAIEAPMLVAQLKLLGIQAIVVDDAELPTMQQARIVHHAHIGNDAFEIYDLRGDCAERILWKQMAVVAVGRVPSRRHPRITDEGRPSILSAAPLPNVGRVDTPDHGDWELWLLCREPTAVYCIKHGEFNYETLGEDCVGSATMNFDLFVRRLIQCATSARQTPGTYAFLHHHSSGCEFRSSEALQQQSLLAWVLERDAPVPVS